MNLEECKALYLHLGGKQDEFDLWSSWFPAGVDELMTRCFAAMWSEHCSYKSSSYWLKELPTQAPWVLMGPGEGAGVVSLDEETAIVFKMESHNHPSAVEPFHGAATGVGGIIRDVLSMGARPIAIHDCLRFAPLDGFLQSHRMKEVIRGLSWYGNCIGVPTVGGDIDFRECYQDNPLVNAMALGVVNPKKIIPSRAQGIGNVLLLYGALTGREGLHGATFASQELDASKLQEDRSSVQIAHPFLEQLLIEATLEMAEQDLLVGLQDLGAAGLLCASTEMATQGDCGLLLHLDQVPQRSQGMKPWEVLLSETQERMLLCACPDKIPSIVAVLEKYEIPHAIVGKVTKEKQYTVVWNESKLLEVLPSWLTQQVPQYQLPFFPRKNTHRVPFSGQEPSVPEKALGILQNPKHACKKWIYQQFDSMVGTQTLLPPGKNNASLLQFPQKEWALAITSGGIMESLLEQPRKAAMEMIAECTRELVCVGATPLAITNCLNFASPEFPEQYNDFVEIILGMKEACLALHTPVTGGNVSFYNQSKQRAIDPSPIVGMIGKTEHPEKVVGIDWKASKDCIVVLGFGPWQEMTFSRRLEINLAVLRLQKDQILASLHDLSEGGLWLSLVESSMKSDLGFQTETLNEEWLFSEGGHRFLVSCSPEKYAFLENFCKEQSIPCRKIGCVQADQLEVLERFSFDISLVRKEWEGAILQHLRMEKT